MPVKKPFIKFNVKSLLPPEMSKAVQDVQTNPGDTGPNPNINTTISFTLQLPSNTLFCPKLTCYVYDYVFKGLSQPLLGTFAIDLGKIIEENQQVELEEIQESGNIIKAIQQVVEGNGMEQISAEELAPRILEIDEEMRQLQRKIKESAMRNSKNPKAGANSSFMRSMLAAGLKGNLLNEKLAAQQNAKKELQDSRRRDMKAMKEKGLNGNKIIIPPRYKFDDRLKVDREIDCPPPSLFIGLGFNPDSKAGKRHYRRYYPDELEDVQEVIPRKPFYEEKIFRGQARGNSKSFFGSTQKDLTGEESTVKEVGYFKGLIKIYHKPEHDMKQLKRSSREELIKMLIRSLYESRKGEAFAFNYDSLGNFEVRGKFSRLMDDIGLGHLNLGSYMVENMYEDMISRMMLQRTKAVVRVYLISSEFMKRNGHKCFLLKANNDSTSTTDSAQIISTIINSQSYSVMSTCYDGTLSIKKCWAVKYISVPRVSFNLIEGFNFANKDLGSASDPYIILKNGKRVFNERDNYQLDTNNPQFHKMYEFDVEFPGASPISIEAFDYDDLFGDDLIGVTTIDLDDRFFSPEWQSMSHKPVEYRQLFHPSSTGTQGVIKLWVEINPLNAGGNEESSAQEVVWDIKPRPKKDYEVRVVVWDTKELKEMDIEGTSDVFIRSYFDSVESKDTDCHYRCKEGIASFNYRLLYNLSLPTPQDQYLFTLQAWDRDFFASNDLIGEAQLDLKALFEDVIETGRTFQITKKYYNSYLSGVMPRDVILEFEDEDTFWVPIRQLDPDSGAWTSTGHVRISLTVLPKKDADANKVGGARSEPNHSPFLPNPTGRLEFKPFDPIGMLKDLIGPSVLRRIYFYLGLALCAFICISLLPVIFANLITEAIMSPFK